MADEETDRQVGEIAPGGGLAEAQIAAIEAAFAEHDRMIGRLRRELEELQERSAGEEADTHSDIRKRLAGLEAKLEQHDQALRHMLQRLIEFFENERPRQP